MPKDRTSENLPMMRVPKAERIAQMLRHRISMGDLSQGAFLPPERELAEQLGTSRKTISDALARLAAEGLVIRAQGRGTQITRPEPEQERTLIRIMHPLHPGARLLWREAFELLRGIEQTLEPLEFRVERFCYIGENPPPREVVLPETPAPTVFLEASIMIQPYLAQLDAAGVPFVVANLEYRDLPYTATWVDHAAAMRGAVKLLADMGHRRIAYIGTAPSHLFYAQSLRGYREGMTDIGAEIDPGLVFHFEAEGMPLDLRGYCAAQQLLALGDPPTAIVAARDAYAEGAWYAIEHAGLAVGRDVALVGYDDLSWSALPSPLTTFREPCYQMGAKAVDLLVDLVVNGPRPHRQIAFESELVLRRSAGPVSCRQTSRRIDFVESSGPVCRGGL